MTSRHTPAHSATQIAPGLCRKHPPSLVGGRRECRALDAPAALCAMLVRAHKRSHHGHTGNTRHSPRNGFNGFLRALPGDRACLPPSPAESSSADLTPASGCQDHTTSPSASGTLVRRTISVHRIPPHVRDDRERPSHGAGRGELVEMICPTAKAEYFFERDWTTQITLIRLDKSDFPRNGFASLRSQSLGVHAQPVYHTIGPDAIL
jgi:hypothetical protein